MDLVSEVVSRSDIDDFRDQLPEDEGWGNLFELVEAEAAPPEGE